MSTDIARLSAAAQALAEIDTPMAALKLMKMAEVARVYARQAELGTEAENAAVAIRLKAEIRLAEAVDEGQKAGEIAGKGRPVNVRSSDIYTEQDEADADARLGRDQDLILAGDPRPATLKDIGVSRQRLSEARDLAAVMGPGQIDAMVAEANDRGRTLSRSAVVRSVRQAAVKQEEDVFEAMQTPASLRRQAVLRVAEAAVALSERLSQVDPPLTWAEAAEYHVIEQLQGALKRLTNRKMEVVR